MPPPGNPSGRHYGERLRIDPEQVRDLFDARAQALENPLHAVMLQKGDSEIPVLRDNFERELVRRRFTFGPSDHVLDLGCGSGRIARYIQEEIGSYLGFDFSEQLLAIARSEFSQRAGYRFHAADITDVRALQAQVRTPCSKFFLIAVLLYVNDEALADIFNFFVANAAQRCSVYIRESVSLLEDRLTLKEVYSPNVEGSYSAIYRTEGELRGMIEEHFLRNGFEITETDSFLPASKAFAETGQRYYMLSR